MAALATLAALVGGRVSTAQQELELSLRNGTVLVASSIVGDLESGFDVMSGGQRRHLAAIELLAVHGAPAQPADLPALQLQGGDQLRGAIVGGDAAGNAVELLSPCLGRVRVNIDRLAVLTTDAATRPDRFVLPEGVDEALFVPAAIGFDIQGGTLHQFGADGVRFQPAGRDAARWYGPHEFAALRLRGATARASEAEAELDTRTGDRVGISIVRSSKDSLRCKLENGAEIEVRWADVACLTQRTGVTYLSDLQPDEVRESGFDGDVVYPWRRDTAVTGEPLVAAGHTHGKGLGVHSRSHLGFVVPAGTVHFWTRVALSSSAGALPLQANAEVRVLVNDKAVFSASLSPGQPPLDTGFVAVHEGDKLVLEADFGRGRDLGDRVNWLTPVLLPAAAKRP